MELTIHLIIHDNAGPVTHDLIAEQAVDSGRRGDGQALVVDCCDMRCPCAVDDFQPVRVIR